LGFAGLVEERKIGDDKMIFEEMQKSSFRGYTDTCLSANQVWVLGFGFWVLGLGLGLNFNAAAARLANDLSCECADLLPHTRRLYVT
jgi:hypothetical protein